MDGGYDQSKNWKVGRSDLSKTEKSELSDLPVFERAERPTFQKAPSLKGGEKNESTQNLTQLPTAITREG